MKNNGLPLAGLKVIDAATMFAAPWAATYLADYGAEVIKIEHPKTGDSSRKYGAEKEGVGIFWKSIGRNKKCITLNLSQAEGKKIFLKLIADVDVFIENFRTGTLEKWGLGWDELHKVNPGLIMLRCTGFGQEGPYTKRGGFGTVAEAMSGFAAINGYPDGPPTLPPIALADGVTSIFAALSIMMAVYERDVLGSGEGQIIDINLYEPLMRLNEASIVEYGVTGTVPKRVGNRIAGAAPRNVYLCKDGKWVALSASSQPIAENAFRAIGRPELISDPRFIDNPARVKNVEELDDIISQWMSEHSMQEVVEIMLGVGAVVSPIYEVDQIGQDPQVVFRQSLVEIEDSDFGKVLMPNVVAKFSRTPGKIQFSGPAKGQHNEEIFKTLGLSAEDLDKFRENGVI